MSADVPRRFAGPVVLAGGAPFAEATLAAAERHASGLVAADMAADRLHALGRRPDLIVGDLDSVADAAAWRARSVEVLHLEEQDTTDFEKCLYATEAPLYLAVGFTGGRVDHTLAVFHGMLARPQKRIAALGEQDAMAFLPAGRVLVLDLPAGARVSLFPFAAATGMHSVGLEWPVDGLAMAPGRQSGTSNRALGGPVEIGFDAAGILLMLEPPALPALVAALSKDQG